ncbi:MAG: GNAT family N-acetyltransferase [Christensenellales bacterium]|jgi:L-amino acid N-acyltransferase YncA
MQAEAERIKIDRAGIGDMPGVMQILNRDIAQMRHTLDTRPWTWAQAIAWFVRHDHTRPILVARSGLRVIGYSALALYKESVGFEAIAESSVYVHEHHRRQGIGLMLLEAILAQAQAIGYSAVIATITADNTASRALHEKAGFRFFGELSGAGRRDGRKVDLVLMACSVEERF